MYPVSPNFHTAIMQDDPQERVLIEFGDFFLNNEDISDAGGLKLTDNFNMDEEITMGGTPSSVLDVSIFNDNNYLNRYSFDGEFSPRIGIQIGNFAYTFASNDLYLQASPTRIITYDNVDGLVLNGVPFDYQPEDVVYAMWSHNDDLYCIWGQGEACHYIWNDNDAKYDRDYSYTTPQIMIDKWVDWAANGRCVALWGDMMQEYFKYDGTATLWNSFTSNTWSSVGDQTWGQYATIYAEVWEYPPLGVFKASRSNRTKDVIIELNAQDRMSKFDIDVTAWWTGLEYPITLQEIYDSLCSYVGVPTYSRLINGSTLYIDPPMNKEEMRGTEVLSLIAEASGSIAKFNRNGILELKWFKSVSYTPDWYYGQEVTEYLVQPIELLEIRNSTTGNDVASGSGSNVYTILDNPFLVGTMSTLTTLADNLFGVLQNPNNYNPSNATVPGDWSVESGDIVTVNEVSTPIFVHNITWNAIATATYENTGGETRPLPEKDQIDNFNMSRAINNQDVVIEGLRLAYLNNKAIFNEDGLNIYQQGLHVYDGIDEVLGFDTDGKLFIKGHTGKFNTLTVTNDNTDIVMNGINVNHFMTEDEDEYWQLGVFNSDSVPKISLQATSGGGNIYADNYLNN